MRRFAVVDVVEPVQHFIAQARCDLRPLGHNGDFHQIGLEAFSAAANTYDCVWVQWVIGHLVDDDMVAFLQVRASRFRALLAAGCVTAAAALHWHAQAARRDLREGEHQQRGFPRGPAGQQVQPLHLCESVTLTLQQPHAQRRALQATVCARRLLRGAGAAAAGFPQGAVQGEDVRVEVTRMLRHGAHMQ